jgi:hypothetical protein
LSHNDALNQKVSEAVSVYDDYMKSKGEAEDGKPNADGEKTEA